MLFSSSRAKAQAETKSDVAYIEAGIQSDLVVSSAEFKETPGGKELLEIVIKKGEATATSTEWEPEKFADETEENFGKRCDGFTSRLLDILGCYYDTTALNVEASSFTELANWFVNLINAADKTKTVRAKLVFNKNGYVILAPGYRYTFIEPMTIAEEDSKIRILAKDVIVRPVKDVDDVNALKSEENPF